MSTNILAPFGALVLVGGFLVVGINKTTTDHFQVESSSVSSSYPIMNEVDDADFDRDFDEDKVHITIIDKKGRPVKDINLELCIPDTDECVRAVHVGDGTFQPVEDIFGGAQGDSLIEVRIPGKGKKLLSSTDTVRL